MQVQRRETVNGVVQINFQPEAGHVYYLNGNIEDSFSVFVSRGE